MPPRLLPPEYGFVDTVSLENAQSVWVEGRWVNKLAAMPSMHFGCAFVVESEFLRGLLAGGRRVLLGDGDDLEARSAKEAGLEAADVEGRRPPWKRMSFLAFGCC